jgi:uncharacterized coiled-coil protein SlyX
LLSSVKRLLTGGRRAAECQSRLDDLEARTAAVEDGLAALADVRAELRTRVLECDEWYEKFRSLYGRLEKRASRERLEEQHPPAQPPLNPAALRLLGR